MPDPQHHTITTSHLPRRQSPHEAEAWFKEGWQADHRCWEDEGVYGGISYTCNPITQREYPSTAFMRPKGVLTDTYCNDEVTFRFSNLNLAERIKLALEGAERLHLNCGQHVCPELEVSSVWNKVPFQKAGPITWNWQDARAQAAHNRLLPDRHFLMVGEQFFSPSNWQEGATLLAHNALQQLATHAQALHV